MPPPAWRSGMHSFLPAGLPRWAGLRPYPSLSACRMQKGRPRGLTCLCLCMYACMHVMHACMHVCMYVCMYICIHTYILTHADVHIHIYIYIGVCVCLCAPIYVSIYERKTRPVQGLFGRCIYVFISCFSPGEGTAYPCKLSRSASFRLHRAQWICNAGVAAGVCFQTAWSLAVAWGSKGGFVVPVTSYKDSRRARTNYTIKSRAQGTSNQYRLIST